MEDQGNIKRRGPFVEHRSLFGLLLLFLALAMLYNLSLPLYEAPDEADHFRYVNWIATGQGLPDLERDLVAAGHEIGQPPLYYALLAPFIAPINTDDLAEIAPFNPDWDFGTSRIVHYHTAAEAFPYQDTALAVHLARFISTLLALLTITCTYGLARFVIPEQAILAAALVAFNPQFIFISAAVTNDTLIAALSAATLLLLTQIIFTDHVRWWRFLLLGAVWGLASLAKVSGLALGVVIGLGLILRARRLHAGRSLFPAFTGLIAGLVAVAGWWLLRNWILFDHPLAWSQFLNANQGLLRPEPLTWLNTLRYAAFLRKSFWAMFGYGIPAPDVYYLMVNALMLAALFGLAIWLLRRRFRAFSAQQLTTLALLALWTLLVFGTLTNWMRLVEFSNQGRLLFPAISSLAVLLALGLANLGRRWPGLLSAALLAAWAVALPLLIIRPAYAQPKPLPATAAIPNPIAVTFDQRLALLGFELLQDKVKPGETLDLVLYWQGLEPIPENYVIRLQVVDAAGQVVAQQDAIPFSGRYPTVLWRPIQPFADAYHLPPIDDNAAPGRGQVRVSVYPIGEPAGPLPVAVTEGVIGQAISLAPFKLAPGQVQQYTPAQPLNDSFGELFRLIGTDKPREILTGQPLEVTLYWEALKPDGHDYTVFVHLLDNQGRLVAQADGQPQANNYPTSFWESGEIIADTHRFPGDLAIPPGHYRLAIGLYDPTTGQRLPATRSDGSHWPDASLELGEVRVLTSR